jgi:YYY domain-containing protein
MSAFARWYLAVAVLGVLALPLSWRLFPNLPDRGYCVSKPLAIFLCGFALWTGTAYGLLRNDLGGAVLAAVVVACASAIAGRSALRPTTAGIRPLLEGLRHRLPMILTVEAVFLLGFGGWALVRSGAPEASHTEQPMDLLLLTSVWSSPAFPPQDPWLAGYPISYYYFGYWLLATVARLAACPPEIAYNLGQACWFGLLLIACFGVGYNLAALARPSDQASARGLAPVSAGILAALAVALVGNLQGVHDAVAAGLAGTTDWWWWPSSRVVTDRDLAGGPVSIIDEFPFFSYLLGDNHPHLLAMPFGAVVVTLALSFSLAGPRGDSVGMASGHDAMDAVPGGAAGLVVTLLVAGGLAFLNPWDVPAAWALLLLGAGLASRRSAALLLLLPVGTAVAYFPYLLSAQSQVAGFVPNLFNPTSLGELARMWAVFAPGLVALIGAAASRGRPARRRVGTNLALILGLSALWLTAGALWAFASASGRSWLARIPTSAGARAYLPLAVGRWAHDGLSLIVLAVVLALVTALIRRARLSTAPARGAEGRGLAEDGALAFALLLAAVGLALLIIPELGFLLDGFGTRMNTVFKFYYAAWLLLALAASHGTFIALRGRGVTRVAGAVSLALLVTGLAFPVIGLASGPLAAGTRPRTLDALAYVAATDPDEMAAIDWVRARTRPDARVLQAVGSSYHAAEDRLSAATGRPTLLGWEGHEVQWRGSAFGLQAAGRAGAVRDIYGDTAPEVLAQLLERWAIDYVYVGPRERALYGITPETEARLSTVMELAFRHGAARIYRRRG